VSRCASLGTRGVRRYKLVLIETAYNVRVGPVCGAAGLVGAVRILIQYWHYAILHTHPIIIGSLVASSLAKFVLGTVDYWYHVNVNVAAAQHE
jgi:hypothetical protein